jgi:2-polyprenyl-6-methoxyphenol hydroxylase-like FAD-dependent oxidoreductase
VTADVLIIGGGICGLISAMLLAREGRRVTVLEHDPAEPPATIEDAWDRWDRPGVAQFRQPHNLLPRCRIELDANLPELVTAMDKAGGAWFHTLSAWPARLADRSGREGDDRFWTITGRRPFLDSVFGWAAEEHDRVSVVRGVKVVGLLTEHRGGIPHVVGARTATGARFRADLVVDAMGRRSPLPRWIQAAGGRPPIEEAEDRGFMYYTRYFRSPGGVLPELLGRTLTHLGTISILTQPGDNGTHSVTLFASTGDSALKRLRHVDVWSNVVAACQPQAHWLAGEPISDIVAMGGIVDRYRRFVVDGTPCATGIVPVADAAMCTNPSSGRGISLGLVHAVRLRDVVRAAPADPAALVHRFDEITETELRPWYDAQAAMDRARWTDIEALRHGRPPPPRAGLTSGLSAAAAVDPDAFRGALDVAGCLATPEQVLARPGMVDRVRRAIDSPPPPPPGPSRDQLLAIVSD